MKMTRSLRYLLAALLLLMIGGSALVPSSRAQTPSAEVDQWSAVLDSERAALEAKTEDALSTYTVNAALVPEHGDVLGFVSGSWTLDWFNPVDEPQSEIYLRLYSNDPRYAEGSIELSDVMVDGEPATAELSVEDTLATIKLPEDVAPGGSATVTLSFVSTIPDDASGSYGMFNHDTRTDSYTLDHWLPLLAGYDPANGYVLDIPSKNGDPVFSNVAMFDVTFTTPADMIVASTGLAAETSGKLDTKTIHYAAGPVREFTLAASKNYVIAIGKAGDTTVKSYYFKGHEERGEATVTWTVDAINLYNELLGVYPYKQFDVVEAVIGGGAAGIEFPQIVFIASDYYADPLDNEMVPHGQEFTVVHEILHQWWYGVVGNNHYLHAFLDESLTNYLTTVYFEKIYDEETSQQQTLINVLLPYLFWLYGLNDGADQIVDNPTDAFPSETDYGTVIYNKGPLGFQALREAMGDDAFFAALQAYFTDQTLGVAQPEDLLAAFNGAADAPIDDVWNHWFNEANGADDYTRQFYENLLRQFGK
jgi:Peptidase family M1 domain